MEKSLDYAILLKMSRFPHRGLLTRIIKVVAGHEDTCVLQEIINGMKLQ
jgi:hypothetical protein